MFHHIEHTLQETWMILPMLFLSYLVIEYIERKEIHKGVVLTLLQKYGPMIGAIMGIIPQCGFSVIASMLFMNRYITMGTLISVFIATSDEAIPLLISHSTPIPTLISMILIKITLGTFIGFIVDHFLFKKQHIYLFSELEEDVEYEDDEEVSACPCCEENYPVMISAFIRSTKIFGFIFLITLFLDLFLHKVGEDVLASLFLNNTLFQPLGAAIIGFIPNCITSILLTQLYATHQLSFASLISGLITNAGLGIATLLRYQASKKDILWIVSILLMSALLCSFILLSTKVSLR